MGLLNWDTVNRASSSIPGQLPPQAAPVPDPGMGGQPVLDTVAAAFRQSNVVTNLLAALARPPPRVPGYNPMTDIAGYEDDALRFVHSASPAETFAIKARLGQERRDRGTLAQAGGWGHAASIAAGVLDPFSLVAMALPVAAPAAWGGRLSRIAAGVGASVAVDSTSEGLLHSAQELRTVEESAINIGAGALLTGVFGAIATRIPRTEFDALRKRLNDEMRATPPTSEVPSQSGSTVGAASVSDAVSLDDLTIARGGQTIAATVGRISPLTRAMQSPLKAVRELTAKLFETPYALNMHASGRTLGTAVETNVNRLVKVRRMQVIGSLEQAVTKYRTRMATEGGEALSLKEFGAQVSMAMRRGDVSDIAEVSEVAKTARRIFDEDRKALQELGVLPEEFSIVGAKSYFPRVYDFEAITRNRTDFSRRLFEWFKKNPKLAMANDEVLSSVEGAPSATSRFFSEEFADAPDARSVVLRDNTNSEVGRSVVRESGDQWQLVQSQLAPGWRGKGYEQRMISDAALEAEKAGKQLVSGNVVTADQLKALEGLRRKGWIVEYANGAEAAEAAVKNGEDLVAPGPVVTKIMSPERVLADTIALEKAARQTLKDAKEAFTKAKSGDRYGKRDLRRAKRLAQQIDEDLNDIQFSMPEDDLRVAIDELSEVGEDAEVRVQRLLDEHEAAGNLVQKARDRFKATKQRVRLARRSVRTAKKSVARLQEEIDDLEGMSPDGTALPRRRERLLRADERLRQATPELLAAEQELLAAAQHRQAAVSSRNGIRHEIRRAKQVAAAIRRESKSAEYALEKSPGEVASAIEEMQARLLIQDEKVAALTKSVTASSAERAAKEAVRKAEQQALEKLRRSVRRASRAVSAQKREAKHNKMVADRAQPIYMEDGEIHSAVGETIDRILGTTRGLADVHNPPSPAPYKQRSLDAPDEILEPYLVSDFERVMNGYARAMTPHIEMRKAGFSSSLEAEKEYIANQMRVQMAKLSSDAEREALRVETANAMKDLDGMRNRLFGANGPKGDISLNLVRAAKIVRTYNYVRSLGSQTLSSMSDYGNIMSRYGLVRTGAMTAKFLTNIRANQLTRADAKRMGTALEWTLDTRANTLADIGDELAGSRLEDRANAAANLFSRATGQATWNSAVKALTSALEQDAILRALRRPAGPGKHEIIKLAQQGIDQRDYERIRRQLVKYADDSQGLSRARTDLWDDKEAARLIENAVVKVADTVVVSRGVGDLPLMMDNEFVKILFQFKSFGMAATNRVLIPMAQGLARGDLAAANGLMMMLALGGLTYVTKEWTSGREPDLSPERIIPEALNWSGALAYFPDVYDLTASVTHTPRFSRFTNVAPLETWLGPTYGTAAETIKTLGGITDSVPWNSEEGDGVSQKDIHQLRKLAPFQNLFYLRRIINALEGEAGEAIGAEGATRGTFINRVQATEPPEKQ